MRRFAIVSITLLMSGTCLLADFSYEQTSKLTGGAMASMMKVVGVFSKQAREPIRTTIFIQGDRMAQLSGDTGTIIDLQKETMTEINFQRKTYSVITFAEMVEAIKAAEAKIKTDKGEVKDLTIRASVKATGQTRQIAGLNANEMLMTLEMEGKDEKTGEPATVMTITTHAWMAPVPGYQEAQSFYQRMAEKLPFQPGNSSLFQMQPEVSKGMADLSKELSKMQGLPVLQTVVMGAATTGQEGEQPAAQPEQQPQQSSSIGGALGRLGGGRFGGFGRGRKKEEPAQAESAPAQSSGAPPSLMEMTIEAMGFSTASIDGSKLEVPAGFKQVDSETLKRMKR